MKLTDLYKHIVEYCGLVENNDKVYIKLDKNKEPFLVNGKQLVIPTRDVLRNLDSESMVVMHPMSEDILRSESVLVSRLRYALGVRINIAVGVLVQSLLVLIENTSAHKGLTPEQTELLYAVSEIDEKTIHLFTKHMLKEINDKEDRLFTYTYLKKGGTVDGKKYPKAGITIFPFYQSLVKGDKYNFRVKDVEIYTKLFQFIFPDIDSPESYNYGSTSEVAPFFDALMFTNYKLTQRIDELFSIYEDYIEGAENMRFNHEWLDLVQNPSTLKNEIRAIPGANTPSSEEEVPSMLQSNPVYQQGPSMLNQGYPNMQPAFMNQAPPVNYSMQNTVVQPPPAKLKKSGNGIDFNSLKAKLGMPYSGMQQPMPNQGPLPYNGDILNRQPVMQQPMPNQGYPNQGMPYSGMQQPMPNQGPLPYNGDILNRQPVMQQPMPNQGYPNQGMPYSGMQQPMPNQGYPNQGMPYSGMQQPMPNQGYLQMPNQYVNYPVLKDRACKSPIDQPQLP